MAEETKNTSTETTVTTTAETTPTVEELQAQLAKATADAERYKSANDKLSKESADYKRQLRAKQSEDERLAEEQAEAQRIRDEEYEAMKAELNHNKAVNAYRSISDAKMVEGLIDAVSTADHATIAVIMEKYATAKVKEAQVEWLKSRPQVNAGQYSTVTKEEIMNIKDPVERQSKIAENMTLFKKER